MIIARYKARLVAKRFNKEKGFDYRETFSLIVKPTTIKILLALAAHYDWPLHQLDVKNTSYMAFCKRMSIWLNLLELGMISLQVFYLKWGFHNSYADLSLIVKTVGTSIIVLLFFVDIIITSSVTYSIHQVIADLTKEFEIKDLGYLHYFLGVHITRTSKGLFLSQQKNIKDLLKTKMMDSK